MCQGGAVAIDWPGADGTKVESDARTDGRRSAFRFVTDSHVFAYRLRQSRCPARMPEHTPSTARRQPNGVGFDMF